MSGRLESATRNGTLSTRAAFPHLRHSSATVSAPRRISRGARRRAQLLLLDVLQAVKRVTAVRIMTPEDKLKVGIDTKWSMRKSVR